MQQTRAIVAVGLSLLVLASLAGPGLAAPPDDGGMASSGNVSAAEDANETEYDENETEEAENESEDEDDETDVEGNETEEAENESDEEENESAGPPAHAGNASHGPPEGVGNATLPPVAGGTPHDLDDDGKVEDVNGNNRTDIADAVQYFLNSDEPAISEHTEVYDYNGDNRTNVADAVLLFREA